MSVMKIKRGTTAAWNLGPELINFEQLAINGKDSVINCCKNTITMTIGAPSMNAPYEGVPKTNGIAIISADELSSLVADSRVCISAKIEPADPDVESTTLLTEDVTWMVASFSSKYTTLLLTSQEHMLQHRINEITYDYLSSIFVKWDAAWCDKPTDVKITLSVRKIGGDTESLAPGQLGAEYLTDGGVALKVGPEGASSTKWNDIPYVGQVLPPCMYVDSVSDLPATAPPGSIIFVRRT